MDSDTGTPILQAMNTMPVRIKAVNPYGKSKDVNTEARGRQENKVWLENRHGSVLDKKSILKVDYVPDAERNRMSQNQGKNQFLFPVKINGAMNLRQCKSGNIFGVSQPSISGIRGVLNLLNCGRNQGISLTQQNSNIDMSASLQTLQASAFGKANKVLWINMREEPLVFINGRVVVLRDRDEPFHNFDSFRGIAKERIQNLEYRLKEDVVEEAIRHGGNVLIHEEVQHRELQPTWEAVPSQAIKTPEEIFFTLRMEGYSVEYERLPCTPEQAPTKFMMDQLIRRLDNTTMDTTIVINCHTGHTRSTFGMVAVCLYQFRRGFLSIEEHPSSPKKGAGMADSFEDSDAMLEMQKPNTPVMMARSTSRGSPVVPLVSVMSGLSLSSLPGKSVQSLEEMESSMLFKPLNASTDETTNQLIAGWYTPVLNLLRLVDDGKQRKSTVDHFCDECSHLVNLRTVIYKHRNKAGQARSTHRANYKIQQSAIALSRYAQLITLDAYLCEKMAVKQGQIFRRPSLGDVTPTNEADSYLNFLARRRDIQSLLHDIIRNPQSSMEIHSLPGTGDISPSMGDKLETHVDEEMHSAMVKRRGTMLNTDTILKTDQFPSDDSNTLKLDIQIRGAPNFRNVLNTRVYGVCTPTVSAIEDIVHYINAASGCQKILWFNLREEPLVYIREKPFVLRSVARPFTNLNSFQQISSKRLEVSEEKLKEDVITEAKRYNGRVLVHSETEERALQLYWEDLPSTEDDVLTPKEVYQNVSVNVNYHRMPQTPEAPPTLADVDYLLELVEKYKNDPNAAFIFNCQMGRGRSTVGMVMAVLRMENHLVEDNEYISDITGSGSNNPAEEYACILSLIRLLNHGVLAKRWLDSIIDRCSAVENIRRQIKTFYDKACRSRTSERAQDNYERALLYLKRYFRLVTVAAYLYNIRKPIQDVNSLVDHENDNKKAYSVWYKERPELDTIFKGIKGKASLRSAAIDKVMQAPPVLGDSLSEAVVAKEEDHAGAKDAEDSEDQKLRFVATRDGTVLVKGSIIKSDHFPGCNRISDSVEGAPNFRSVSQQQAGQVKNDKSVASLRIYGTGMPTIEGVRNICTHIIAKSGGTDTKIDWISLREEPILYVNGRPFVLRKLEHPFQNLEHTGISRERVEDMEKRLKFDVLQEIEENDGNFLLHDEDETGLTPHWEQIDYLPGGNLSVLTPMELYSRMRDDGFNVTFHRVPVTDEQAPKVTDYDAIMEIVLNASDESHVVVNCQMGRGRTTTGLVVSVATRLWRRNQFDSLPIVVSALSKLGMTFRAKTRSKDNSGLAENKLTCLKGEYKIIVALTRVLARGTHAKNTIDAVVDVCDKMQNLREAVYDLKERSELPDLGPVQKAAALSRGLHYLRRYYQLIEFSAYLISRPVSKNPAVTIAEEPFSIWIKSRPELKNIIRRVSLDI